MDMSEEDFDRNLKYIFWCEDSDAFDRVLKVPEVYALIAGYYQQEIIENRIKEIESGLKYKSIQRQLSKEQEARDKENAEFDRTKKLTLMIGF
jgi:hypothetical protein